MSELYSLLLSFDVLLFLSAYNASSAHVVIVSLRSGVPDRYFARVCIKVGEIAKYTAPSRIQLQHLGNIHRLKTAWGKQFHDKIITKIQ